MELLESPRHTELYKYRLDAGDKYIYYILSVTAACIALVVQMTLNTPLARIHMVLGVAVLLWIVSFYYGCKCITRLDQALALNIQGLSMSEIAIGQRMRVNPRMEEAIKNSFEYYARKSAKNRKRQFSCLIIGTLFFLWYHIYNMAHQPIAPVQKTQINLFQQPGEKPQYIWNLTQ